MFKTKLIGGFFRTEFVVQEELLLPVFLLGDTAKFLRALEFVLDGDGFDGDGGCDDDETDVAFRWGLSFLLDNREKLRDPVFPFGMLLLLLLVAGLFLTPTEPPPLPPPMMPLLTPPFLPDGGFSLSGRERIPLWDVTLFGVWPECGLCCLLMVVGGLMLGLLLRAESNFRCGCGLSCWL